MMAMASVMPLSAFLSQSHASGGEVIWNHLLRYRGETVGRWIAQAVPTRSGKYTLVKFEDEFDVLYSKPGAKFAGLNNIILYFKQKVIAPARLAGFILLAHETLNQVKQPRAAWTYNTGQRRVRRAPNVAYDNPGTASDGMRTSDQFDMFNGAPDRYNWELVGRKEMIVPYNAYKLHSNEVKYKDILTPKHINPELARYELHRVWVSRCHSQGRNQSYLFTSYFLYRRRQLANPRGRPV